VKHVGERREHVRADQQLGGREQLIGEVLVAVAKRGLRLVEQVGRLAQARSFLTGRRQLATRRWRRRGACRRRGRGGRAGGLLARLAVVVAIFEVSARRVRLAARASRDDGQHETVVPHRP
jgi:hypothetical protein